jgi:hypothetical protein
MGWMRRMVPGVDEMETGEAVTVLTLGKIKGTNIKKAKKKYFKSQKEDIEIRFIQSITQS